MGHQVKPAEDQIALVRSVVGGGFSEMDIVRALHMANYDATAAINIIFDTPHLRLSSSSSLSPPASTITRINSKRRPSSSPPPSLPTTKEESTPPPHGVNSTNGCGPPRSPMSKERYNDSEDELWWLVGGCEVAGLSTCKGPRLKPGDRVAFSFPHINKTNSNTAKLPGRGRSPASCSEIVRFSTKDNGEIGRIPNEWARCLSPLVSENKIKIEGHCSSAPEVLCIMDTILLSIRIYLNSSMFRKQSDTSIKSIRAANEDSTVHPLPSLFKLLGMTPFKNAEITPEELYMRKRQIASQVDATGKATMSTAGNCRKVSSDGTELEDDSEAISDADLDNIVGTTDSSELEEMDPPETLTCELRPYQKQALHWMLQVERGNCMEEAATTLHPCWDAYHLTDKRKLVVYLNAFTGDATTEFPSTHQIARGGILADSMGLGKTIMTISLLLALNERGDSSTSSGVQTDQVTEGFNHLADHSSNIKRKRTSISSFVKLKAKSSLVGGGSLVICPMTLLGQWKAEIETHTRPGSLTVYLHYGQSRPKDAKTFAQNDVVITTYGVLASEFSSQNAEEIGGLYAVRWFRIVLDEAHTIKSSKSQISIAAAALTADRRWCLTGTPIQNKLEDVYSLLRFLRVEPWGNWGLWHKLIQKPYEEGDERGLKLVQSILKPIMLRRTKFSTDKEGRPILVLPPADVQVIYCEMTVAEKDFYEALFKRSKVKFDQFVEQGRVLHNYASILELLLRLRQCCDHPFLVMSRGDTQEYSDLNKLAKRFLKGGKGGAGGDANDVPSKAYISEVVEELRKGEEGECPICLEVFEDAVLTPCAHRLCRECLFASWRSATTGLCPVCRKSINKQDLITAPTESRFQIDVNKNWVESSKISVLLQELENLRNSGSKSIIFSQWTAFLDLLQIPLSRSNFTYVRLDGTLSQQQREKVISEFTNDRNIMVLLMSLKAGGVGINLTAACNAFLLDPWWNPAVEEQAVMRIHRIGQSKSVSIKRFIVKGTVEEKMEAVQARKQRMIMGALTDQEVRTARIEELKMLFT